MRPSIAWRLLVVLQLSHASAAAYVYPPCPAGDTRCIPNGAVFSNKSNSYAEQPYCFVRSDDEWICGLTYNKAGWEEGTPGECVQLPDAPLQERQSD